MADLSLLQYLLIGMVFVWSGFVRSGLGFGGAVLSLPFLLLIHNDLLVFLPIIAIHLLIFSSLIFIQAQRQHRRARASDPQAQQTVAWSYLGKALSMMLVPKLIGVFGLITLPAQLMGLLVFVIVSLYALSYIFNRPLKSKHPLVDGVFLMLGAYVSGTSLIGAPLITAVFASHLAAPQLRDTLFVLWFILVAIKVAAFLYFGVDMQWTHHLWLLPCATLGHVMGLRFHARLLHAGSVMFYRVLGSVILVAGVAGLYRTLVEVNS